MLESVVQLVKEIRIMKYLNKKTLIDFSAPLLDGNYAICNPNSTDAYCCSLYGSCGSTPLYCNCQGCVNFKLNPTFKWQMN
jgi:hypothetical protein